MTAHLSIQSAHLSIQSAIVAALLAAPALAGGNVQANTLRPVASSKAVAVVVRLLQSRAATPKILGGPYDWVTTFQVECLARGAAGSSESAAAVDGLLELAWQRLSTINPTGLGVMDVRMAPAIDWQMDESETPLVAAVISLQVNHRTQATTLAAWS